MLLRRIAASILALGVLGGSAFAQDYPAQPIRLVVPFAPGAGSDTLGRMTAEALTPRLGQTVFVENKAGAGSAIGIDLVAKSKPDGYNLLWTASDGISVLPAVKPNVPYRVPEDFTFVARVTTLPLVISVNPNLPIKTFAELVAYAKANPGKLRYGTPGVGGGPHMTAVRVAKAAGIDMVHVPFQGAGPSVTAVLGGHIDLVVTAPATVKGHVDAGTLRALVTTGKERHPHYTSVPTLQEAGVPQAISVFYGVMAPAGMPEPILVRLRAAMDDMLKDPKIIDRLASLGYKPEFLAGDDFKKYLVDELNDWKELAKSAGITVTD